MCSSDLVIWLLTHRVVPVLAAGVLAGTVLSAVASTWARSLLYGVQSFDPASDAAAILLLIAIGIGAAAVPAFRALRLDPSSVLRQE